MKRWWPKRKVKLFHPYYELERKVCARLEGRTVTIVGYVIWAVTSVGASIQYLSTHALNVSVLAGLALGVMVFFVLSRLSTLLTESLFQGYLDGDLIEECTQDLRNLKDPWLTDAVDRFAGQRNPFVQTRTTLPVILISVLIGLWAVPSPNSFLLIMAIVFTAPSSLVLLRELRRARAATIIQASVEEVRFQLYQEQKLQETLVLGSMNSFPGSIDTRLPTVYTTHAPKMERRQRC